MSLPMSIVGSEVDVKLRALWCGFAGGELQEGVHRKPGSSACHSEWLLEDDLGEEHQDYSDADQVQRAGTSEFKNTLQTHMNKHTLMTQQIRLWAIAVGVGDWGQTTEPPRVVKN